MEEYRKKMEEQKRLRETILREKENRRKMAAMEKQSEENKNEIDESGWYYILWVLLRIILKNLCLFACRYGQGSTRADPVVRECRKYKYHEFKKSSCRYQRQG